jgi:uncharacterized protein
VKIVIPGGSGQVGTILARAFVARGDEVVVLSRRLYRAPWHVIEWDGASLGGWTSELDGSDVVINLAGRSVNCRYTPKNRREILESRVQSTRVVGQAIENAKQPPPVWLQASTATIYAHRYDAPNDERTGILGGHEPDAPETWRFSIEVADAWEAAAREARVPTTRQVLMRSAMIMSPDRGGVFDTLYRLVRLGLGGPAAGGRQFVSWIHHQDFARAVMWLVDHPELAGPVNISAPNPLPQSQFMSDLRRAASVPVGLPATHWMLEVGAFFLRTETELVLKSRRVVPGRLIEAGFEFAYPKWPDAAKDLTRQ